MQIPVVQLENLRSALAAFNTNKALYLLETPSATKVLFRIDGLVVQVSDIVFELLQGSRSCLEDSLESVLSTHGYDSAMDAIDAIISAAESRIVQEEPAPLKRPDPRKVEPTGILIMVTQTCNLACTYCYAGGGTYGGKTKLMSEESALRAIDVMLQRAPGQMDFTVTLFGGEPLLNFPLVRRIVDYCDQLKSDREVRFHFSMTTNGTIVTDEIIEFLKAKDFTLMVSFDGIGQEKYRPFASGDSSDSLVHGNLQRLAAAGIPFQLRATLTKDLVKRETVENLVQIGRSLGNKKVMMSPVSETRNAVFPANEELALDPADIARLQEIYRSVTEENIEAARLGSTEKAVFDPAMHLVRALAQGKAVGLGRCGAGLGMSAASTDGNIYPCHRFVGMKEYAIGTIEDGVDPQKVQDFFSTADAANKEKCDVCFARQICGGFCFYNISDGQGGFVPPSEQACDSFRESVKYAIGTLLRVRELSPNEARQYLDNTSV